MKPPCNKCKADCCVNVPMTITEFNRLMKIKPRSIPKYKTQKIAGGHILVKGKCPWVTKDYKCSVYKDRPYICVASGTEKKPCHRMEGFNQAIEDLINKLTAHHTQQDDYYD